MSAASQVLRLAQNAVNEIASNARPSSGSALRKLAKAIQASHRPVAVPRIPLAASDERGDDSIASAGGEQARGRVLVVEDNIVNQQLATRLLERKGFQVDVAANGFEGIELFKANQYRLIFMDCLMPDLDGYECTQIIREIEKTRAVEVRTPIIALTAHAIEGEAERCFQVGMDEFITKPFKLTKLEMVLDRYIQ